MEFEWDPSKAASNLRKHGVDFADAVAVWNDDRAISIHDEHPDEERFVTIGMDTLGRVLVVVYAMRDHVIRVISARRARSRERQLYEGKQR